MKILIFDIETMPLLSYHWRRWKQNIAPSMTEREGYIQCYAAKWYGDDKMYYDGLDLHGNSIRDERYVASSLHRLLDEADALVTFNGNKFDIPVVNTALVKHGFWPPSSSKSIDLFRVVKNRFSFSSSSLNSVCEQLGLGGKADTGGWQLWKGCMDGDPEAWAKMRRYNEQDVLLTEELYVKLRPWIHNHPNVNLYDHLVNDRCPTCGSVHIVKNGSETLAAGVYQRYKCQDCGTNMRGKTMLNTKSKRDSLMKAVK